jgi:hypothetical protein
MKTFKDFIAECEGGAASVSGGSVVGTGHIAGAGVSNPTLPNQAEPGVNRKKKNALLTILPLTRKH